MTLCKTFRDIARQTWNQLRDCRRVHHQLLEETITDLHCLFLKTAHPSDICVVNYTKLQESLNGSDWLWLFIDKTGRTWIKVRVQAKIINLAQDKYLKLGYGSGGLPQLTKLANAARADGSVPLYAFYSHWQSAPFKPNLLCPPHTRRSNKRFGCSLATLPSVQSLTSKKAADVQRIVFPWEDLVCPRLPGAMNLPERIGSALARFHSQREPQEQENRFRPQPIDRVPDYLLEALKSLGFAHEFSVTEEGPDEDLGGVIIIRDPHPPLVKSYEEGFDDGFEKGIEQGRKDFLESGEPDEME